MAKIEDAFNLSDKIFKNFQTPDSSLSSEALEALKIRDYRLADWMQERIVLQINEFEEDLPQTHQAGGRLVTSGNIAFSIEDVGYHNPDMLIFYGTLPDGSKVELLQHTAQLNLLLVAVQRSNPEVPRRKIGFAQEDE